MQNDWDSLDRYDRAILRVLSDEGRISIADLSRRIGLSKSPTQARLRRLETDGVITGYRALIDPIRLGLDLVAFVEVRLSDTREAALAAFNTAVARVGEIEPRTTDSRKSSTRLATCSRSNCKLSARLFRSLRMKTWFRSLYSSLSLGAAASDSARTGSAAVSPPSASRPPFALAKPNTIAASASRTFAAL